MAGTLPTAAEIDLLTDMIASILNGWYMRLYTGNITPTTTTTLASLSAVEATFTGYAAVNLTTWSAPTIDGTSAAISVSTQGVFTATSGGGTGNLYGYYLTNAGQTKLYGAERFVGAPITQANGVAFAVNDTFSLLTRF